MLLARLKKDPNLKFFKYYCKNVDNNFGKGFFLGRGVVGFFASSFQIISQSNDVDNMLHQGKVTAHSCIRSAAHWLGIRSERGH